MGSIPVRLLKFVAKELANPLSLGYFIYLLHGPSSLDYVSKPKFPQFIRTLAKVQLLIIEGFHYYLLLGCVRKG